MDYSGRLAKVFEGTKFDGIPNQNDAYPLIDLGRRNIREFEKLSDIRRAIIFDLLSEILANIIQPKAIEKFGCADSQATVSIIRETFDLQQTMDQDGLDKQLKKEIMAMGLTEVQAKALAENLISDCYAKLIQLIADLVNRWRLFPTTEAPSIALALTHLMKEVAV